MLVAAFVMLATLSFAAAVRTQEPEAPTTPGGLFGTDRSENLEAFRVHREYLHEEFADPTRGFAPRKYKYMVQDATGSVIGHMVVSITSQATAQRNLVVLSKRYDFADALLKLTVAADTFDPVTVEVTFAGGLEGAGSSAPAESTPAVNEETPSSPGDLSNERGRQQATYYFDTVSVSIERPGATTLFTFRRPLPGYDIEELFLLMNVMEMKAIPERSIWFLTASFERATHAVLVERQGKETIYGADAERHLAVRLRLTSDIFSEDYFVESLSPHRVVRFTAGDLTFTLWEEMSEEATPVAGGVP